MATNAEQERPPQAEKKTKPERRPLSENRPRETKRREPKQKACPDCGGALRLQGEVAKPTEINIIAEPS